MKKVVLQLNFEGGEIKKKVMGKVSKIKGVVSIEIGSDKKMTVIGDMDPVLVDKKLKTLCSSKILHVGPAEAVGENGVQQAATMAAAAATTTPATATTTYVRPPQIDYPYLYPYSYPYPYPYPYNHYPILDHPPTAPPWPLN